MATNQFINKKNVRQYTLDRAQITGRKQFVSVGQSFYDRVETRLRMAIDDELHRHPSKGKTLL